MSARRRHSHPAGSPPGPLPALLGGVLAAAALALLPAAAQAQSTPTPVGPWDGQNPFNCLNQDVGTGTDFPDPDADPFCVEFDKTSQNVTDFGIVDFLAKEPARVAAASTKCFYYQRDHWTGSIVQGADPELWNWDGSYFFDRAKGIGGAHLTNFRIGGVPQDGTPYAPPQYHPYFSETGGGGAIVLLETDPDPVCGALVDTPAERAEIYRNEPRYRNCAPPGGQIKRRRIGRVKLGMTRDEVWKRLGPPRKRRRSTHRWCLVGGARLHATFRDRVRDRRGGGAPRGVALLTTSHPGQAYRGVGPRTKRRRAVRRLELERRFRVRRTRVFIGPRDRRRVVLAGIRGRRVRWIGIADPVRLQSDRRIRTALRAYR